MTNPTAAQQVFDAARAAGLPVRYHSVIRAVVVNHPNRAVEEWLSVDFDRAGRLTGAHRYLPDGGIRMLPAAGLLSRVLGWIETRVPAERDPFEDVERGAEAADALEQGGVSGLAQLDQRRRTLAEVKALEDIDFTGLADAAGLADRIRQAAEEVETCRTFCSHCGIDRPKGCPHARQQAAWVSVDRLSRDDFEVGLHDVRPVILSRAEAVALVARLNEALSR